jgi:hypothetical protein
MSTLTMKDRTGSATPPDDLELPDVPARLTLRELIRMRVREDVARFNAGRSDRVTRLVKPDEAEREPRGGPRNGPVDWEPHAEAACRAFTRNGFFVFVGGRQIERLDDEIDLSGDPSVVFLKLVQLVGD